MTRPLTAVKRTATRRNQAIEAYREAILQARAHGHTMPEIAAAAGTTKQSVWRLLGRNQ